MLVKKFSFIIPETNSDLFLMQRRRRRRSSQSTFIHKGSGTIGSKLIIETSTSSSVSSLRHQGTSLRKRFRVF